MKTKRLVTDALCAAMFVVLATFASLRLGPMTISLSGLPILLGAVLFGPLDGFLIGLLGEFISQLLSYGLSVTTALWILPPGILGLIVGWYAKRKGLALCVRQYQFFRQYLFILLLGLIADTTLTTGVMWVDCLVYKYSFTTYAPYILWRYIADIIKAVVYVNIIPPLVMALRKACK